MQLRDGQRRHFRLREGACAGSCDAVSPDEIARVKWVTMELLRRHSVPSSTVLVIGHAVCGSVMIELLLGLTPFGRFRHDHGGLSHLTVQDDGVVIVNFLNR